MDVRINSHFLYTGLDEVDDSPHSFVAVLFVGSSYSITPAVAEQMGRKEEKEANFRSSIVLL